MAALFSSSGPVGAELKISDAEFVQLRDFIYAQCGIYVADNRKYLLENRLANRLKLLNLKSFGEYYHYLQYDSNKKAELSKLFEVITTNETSFYRNPPQLKVFQENILAEVIAELKKKGDKRLRIWSASAAIDRVSATSTSNALALPWADNSSAAERAVWRSRSHSRTAAPARSSRSAVARPSPRAAPLTTHTWPANSVGDGAPMF